VAAARWGPYIGEGEVAVPVDLDLGGPPVGAHAGGARVLNGHLRHLHGGALRVDEPNVPVRQRLLVQLDVLPCTAPNPQALSTTTQTDHSRRRHRTGARKGQLQAGSEQARAETKPKQTVPSHRKLQKAATKQQQNPLDQ
jgi:hypothetical protein